MRNAPQRIVVGMVDGFGIDYFTASDMPNMRAMAGDGVFRVADAVVPTVTNVNNVSIASSAWPEAHGITGNSYLDASGAVGYMEDAHLRLRPTILEEAQARGVGAALLTCKEKTARLLGQDVTVAVVAESPTPGEVKRYGAPPPVYSAEINLWLWKAAADILEHRRDVRLLYVHTTDFPMHMWAPQAAESLAHLAALDAAVGAARTAAPDAAFLFTGDHGVARKTRCIDLANACEAGGAPVRLALSVERDRYVRHHRTFGGCAWVWLRQPADADRVGRALRTIAGIEHVLPRGEAAARFHLMPERIGDFMVLADIDTVFGDLDGIEEALAPDYRSHGSLYEQRVPLVVWNYQGPLPRPGESERDAFTHNFHVTRPLFASWLPRA